MTLVLTLDLLLNGVLVETGTVLLRSEDAALQAGPGTLLRGSSLIAATSGLAMVDSDQASVFPAQIHRGDVLRGQPLICSGNLVVTGSLEPGAQIRAGGAVGVRGEAHNARIEAMGAVVLLTGCSHSHVAAGANQRAFQQSLARVEAVEAELRRLVDVIAQLKGHPKFRTVDLSTSLRPLMQILVEHSFAGFSLQISEVIKRLALHQHHGRALNALREILERRYADGALLDLSQTEVEGTQRLAAEAVAILSEAIEARHDLTVRYDAISSKLIASGSILVAEGNSLASALKAGVGVQVSGKVDGGVLSANEWIQAQTISGGGSVEVEGPGRIQAGTVASGTLVRVGHISERFTSTASTAEIRLVEGRLQVGGAS